MSKTNKINLAFCIFLIISIIFVSFCPIFLIPQINTYYRFDKANAKDGVFLELWNVDTFEGGTNSRSKFLENVAIAYEKTHKKEYVIVRNLTIDELKNMLSQNKVCDLISFGGGVGELIRPFCNDLSDINSNLQQKFKHSGEYNGQQLSLPWCVGGYVKCSDGNGIKNPVYGVGVENTIPPTISGNKKIYKTQYEAYNGYLKGEFDILLGTQRDYFRLSNKLTLGLIQSCVFEYETSYTDLLQQIAVCCTEEKSFSIAKNFISFLLSDENQKKLKDIGMFSGAKNLIYSGTKYEDFEQAVYNVKSVGNVFVDDLKRLELQQKV